MSHKLYYILLFFTIAWCLFIFLAPALSANGFTLQAGFVYYFFSHICHQLPDRSFVIFEKPLAVCSRCTAIYIGFLTGVLLYPFLKSLLNNIKLHHKIILFAMLPLSIDYSLTILNIWQNTFYSRTITGFIVGIAFSFLITPGFIRIFDFQGGKT